ncbi:MAG: ABC-F family ATP-binding cassette domain-containing protein [Caulobacteraceae bacterium]|nr:ABC-F family ATP-binding cassette domain-containing protein [Caulobacteraceae bacterium]
MSFLVTLDRLGCRTPDGRLLFDKLTLAFGRERTGLVGRNGAGKTTLLNLVSGELAPTEGAVARAGRIGVLRQAARPLAGASVADLIGLAEPLARLARIERGEGSEQDLAEADWSLPARLEAALAEVDLPDLAFDRPAATLSGGQLTRARLAALVAEAPDLLLLDEPTNNLDAEARALVARVLRGWKGGAVVVSHDRALLREMDRIVELSGLGARVYGGGWDLYAERRAQERAAAARDLEAAERGARQVDRDIQAARERKQRRDAAGQRAAARGGQPWIVLGAMAERAELSGGRASQLAERQRAEAAEALAGARAKVERLKTLAVELPASGLAAGKRVLAFEDVGFAWPGGAPVLSGVGFEIVGPGRVAVTGRNGAGKTTLLRLAVGDLEPGAGRVLRGGRVALLDQRTAMLDEGETILGAFRRLNPGSDDNACRAALARFLFRAEAALKPVAALSGGERLRAALACVLGAQAPPQLLILDEPTNHLDLDSIVAIEAALAGYDGALLVVSHDRDFLDAIGVEREIVLGVRPPRPAGSASPP